MRGSMQRSGQTDFWASLPDRACVTPPSAFFVCSPVSNVETGKVASSYMRMMITTLVRPQTGTRSQMQCIHHACAMHRSPIDHLDNTGPTHRKFPHRCRTFGLRTLGKSSSSCNNSTNQRDSNSYSYIGRFYFPTSYT